MEVSKWILAMLEERPVEVDILLLMQTALTYPLSAN
jgi:hypothetical protein